MHKIVIHETEKVVTKVVTSDFSIKCFQGFQSLLMKQVK